MQNKRPFNWKKLKIEFKWKFDALVSKVERIAPNLKALDQYKTVEEKEWYVTKEIKLPKKEEFGVIRWKIDPFEHSAMQSYLLSTDIGSTHCSLATKTTKTGLSEQRKRKKEVSKLFGEVLIAWGHLLNIFARTFPENYELH